MNGNHLIRRICLLAALFFCAGTGWAEDEHTDEYPFSPGSLLEIDLPSGGSALITGWDRGIAQVTYYDDVRDVEDHRIECHPRDGGLAIASEPIRRRNVTQALTFEIFLPRRADVEVRSGGGSLELTDLEGTFVGRIGGGELVLRGLSGRARLQTGGGEIKVTDCKLDGRVSTGGGEVLLENVVGDLEATSGGGNVQYKNVRDREGRLRAPGNLSSDDMTDKTVVISTAGGGIRVREAPEGARLQTGGGDITVRRAARFVTARTGGGDISVEIEDGWVEASTGAGDIDVDVSGSLGDGREGLELLTGLGEVTVTLPPGLSAELDLELGYTRNSSRDFEIDSDLDIDIEHSKEWDYDHGTPRKFIWGTAKFGDGRHLIKITNTNGNIRIRTAR